MRDLVIFDIDGTLFDPEHFGKLIRAEFVKMLNVSEEDLMRTIADYYAGLESTSDFTPHDITLFIAQRHKGDQEALNQIFWENRDVYQKSLYPEVFEVLKILSKEKTLGLFSQGNEKMQLHKLGECNILKFFNKNYYFIHRRKGADEAIALLPRGSTIVDDNHDLVLKIAPFVDAIWMNRRTEDKDPNIRTVHSLEELVIDDNPTS